MSTAAHPISTVISNRLPEISSDHRRPHHEITDTGDALLLAAFMPDVDAVDIELIVRGPDLIITARKKHIVRTNWRALHLEAAQHDYLLRLRLGTHIDYDTLKAELSDNMLTLVLPKKRPASEHLRYVA